MTETNPILRHGGPGDIKTNVPDLGCTQSIDEIDLQIIREAPFEVHFQSDRDCLTLPLGLMDCEVAYDSDKITKDGSTAGMANMHAAGSRTYARTLQRVGELVVIDTPPDFRKQLTDKVGHDPFQTGFRCVHDPEITAIAQMVRRMVLQGEPVNRLMSESVALLAYSAAYRGADANLKADRNALNESKLNATICFIEAHLDENLGLSTLAAQAGLSTFHFARSFKLATGTTPYQYILDRRIARARQKLAGDDESIAAIAYDVGFSSQSHFTEVFKRTLGVTLAKYRNELKK